MGLSNGKGCTNPEDVSKSDGSAELFYQFKDLKAFPQEVFETKGLVNLQLDFNQITTIPPEIGKLTSLMEFSIGKNKLQTIPPEIGQLTSLRYLNLGMNKLTSFNGEFLTSLHKLKQLILPGNFVTSLPNLEELTHLKTLNLSENNLDNFFATNPTYKFPPALDNLNLSSNHMTVCPSFSNVLPSLTILDISENRMQSLPSCLAQMPNIRRLFLGGNLLTALPIGFENSWKNLLVLSLSFNAFKTLPQELSELPVLRNLDIRGNGFVLSTAPNSVLHLLAMLKGEKYIPDDSDVEITIDYEDDVPDEIVDGVYLGCLMCAKNKFSLQKLGITHILTVADFKPFFPELFKYEVVQIDDEHTVDIYSHFESSIKFITDALASGGKVLVHCRAGISRSASVVIAYVMHKNNLARDDGIEFVKTRRPRILPNKGFYTQLGRWEEAMKVIEAAEAIANVKVNDNEEYEEFTDTQKPSAPTETATPVPTETPTPSDPPVPPERAGDSTPQ